jgi:probable phosphoglycerate mutase
MTLLLLIRHGETDAVGRRLSGWTRGVHLNERGREQAAALCEMLAALPLAALYVSPLERAIETARPLSRRLGLEMIRSRNLLEVNYGDYTGKTFSALRRLRFWQEVHRAPSRVRFPGGESFLEVQSRAARFFAEVREGFEGRIVAAFTHGDIIRLGLAYGLGLSLDLFQRFTVSPASLSAVEFLPHATRILAVNLPAGAVLPPGIPPRERRRTRPGK